MDGGIHHHRMKCEIGEREKVNGVLRQCEEHDGDGKKTKKRKKALAGERRIVVSMKLAAAYREVLTWTIVKVAHPGDLVIALHVAPFPSQSGNCDHCKGILSMSGVYSRKNHCD